MKRLRVDESLKEGGGSPATVTLFNQNTAQSTLIYSSAGNVKVVSEGMQSGLYPPAPVSYGAMPTVTAPHPAKTPTMQFLSVGGHSQLRTTTGSSPPNSSLQQEMQSQQQQQQPQQQQQSQPQQSQQQQSPGGGFQRLKVEDALSYLDLVKYKFGSKPQVYNDFLDIMKEFKSQTIDTPGVIQRVSNLFKGFPDLIVGFNTFLPPGYKIEVQKNDKGYDFHVSVSMPCSAGTMSADSQQQKMISAISQCQPLSLTQHVPPVAPQAAPSIPIHHSSSYGNSTPTYNNSITLSAAQVAVSQALQGHTDTPQNQPVQFNHAINYVNKIKNRFQDQPEKYKRFLDILHIYQKEQRNIKEAPANSAGGKHLTEQEVYSQVAKLFENQSDLLAEFGQFLPDATSHINPPPITDHSVVKKPPVKQPYRDNIMDRMAHKPSHVSSQQKRRSPSFQVMNRDVPPPKKHKLSSYRDVTLAEAGAYGTLNDYAFFDKVRKAVRSQEVYNNFLRCLTLFNQEVISKSELMMIVNPFLNKFPELMRWFREFLGQHDIEAISSYNANRPERPQGDTAYEIDLTTAKRLGASYCVIPPSQEGKVCSGRTQLCKEVLNDQWVSFPTWSEDSTFVSSRKTQYEEYIYRCEDERFELDVVIETNASAIRVLEGVNKKLSRMTPDEVSKFRLDDCLGGNSQILHQRAVKRVYGDKAPDIIDGLKRNPAVAVPVVLRRLKAKEEEWRDAQKGFNKIWREQNEKYYLKSLDHQGMNFKQTDVKALRSKSLFNEIETLFDERHEQNETSLGEPITGPHITFSYKECTILDDAATLLIHHVKRQTAIQKSEKRRIKALLRQFIPDIYFHPKKEHAEDEFFEDRDDRNDRDDRDDDRRYKYERDYRDDRDDADDVDESPSSSPSTHSKRKNDSPGKSPGQSEMEVDIKIELDVKDEEGKTPLQMTEGDEEAYCLFFGNNNWYIFLRLHSILCERLTKIYERSLELIAEEEKYRVGRKESTEIALRLKPKPHVEVEDYYVAFLDMVKSVLDGQMDSNTFEDTLREMFGIHAYTAFTLDKVILYAVRQLQHCVTERTAMACTDLFYSEYKKGGAGGLCHNAQSRAHLELAYQRAAEKAVQDENCFKIYIYKKGCRVTIELLDTDSVESKKVDEAKKWSTYKERYANCRDIDGKPRSPLFLGRNMRAYKKRFAQRNKTTDKNSSQGESSDSDKQSKNNDDKNATRKEESDKKFCLLEDFERKLNERPVPERNQVNHPGYIVSDETECKFNTQDFKVMFTVNKDSFCYKLCALTKARKSHPEITKRLSSKFRAWLKRWVSANVSDVQNKQCTDWLMGRGEGVVPNRTRVLTDNDLSKTPYIQYNRYRVERLKEDST